MQLRGGVFPRREAEGGREQPGSAPLLNFASINFGPSTQFGTEAPERPTGSCHRRSVDVYADGGVSTAGSSLRSRRGNISVAARCDQRPARTSCPGNGVRPPAGVTT